MAAGYRTPGRITRQPTDGPAGRPATGRSGADELPEFVDQLDLADDVGVEIVEPFGGDPQLKYRPPAGLLDGLADAGTPTRP